MRFLDRLERRFGGLAIPDLGSALVGLTGLVLLLGYIRPEFLGYLVLDAGSVRAGQLWRLLTFQFVEEGPLVLMLLVLLWKGMVYRSLEEEWGPFRFTVYWAVGTALADAGTLLGGSSAESASVFGASFFLAFATLFPNYKLRLFFVISVAAKWLGLVSALYFLATLIFGDSAARIAVAVGLTHYGLFFAGHWADYLRGARRTFARARTRAAVEAPADRRCAICGVRQAEGADIRVCSCAACGGRPRDLCMMHAQDHSAPPTAPT